MSNSEFYKWKTTSGEEVLVPREVELQLSYVFAMPTWTRKQIIERLFYAGFEAGFEKAIDWKGKQQKNEN